MRVSLFSLICFISTAVSAAQYNMPVYNGCYRPQASGYCGFYAYTFKDKNDVGWLEVTYLSLPGLADPACDGHAPFYFSFRKDGNFWNNAGERWLPRGQAIISPENIVNLPTECN